MKCLLGAVFLILSIAPGVACAQQSSSFKFKEKKVIIKIPKPEIGIYIDKQNLTPKYDLELRESFLPKVFDSVDRKPF